MSYARFVNINISTFICNGKFAMINASRMIFNDCGINLFSAFTLIGR